MSARTDLCGGYQATGIPTATQSGNFMGPVTIVAWKEVVFQWPDLLPRPAVTTTRCRIGKRS
jgi:hypothetical protein